MASIVFTKSGTTVTAYLDGGNDGGGTTAASITTSNDPLHIASGNGVGNYVDGMMDDIRIYDRALTPAEVKQLYNLGT